MVSDHSYGMDSHEDNAGELLQRIVDLEEFDKETSSLIVFLLMQYMSRPEHVVLIILYINYYKSNFNITFFRHIQKNQNME